MRRTVFAHWDEKQQCFAFRMISIDGETEKEHSFDFDPSAYENGHSCTTVEEALSLLQGVSSVVDECRLFYQNRTTVLSSFFGSLAVGSRKH